jgi:glutamate dehydrogenase (NADP+)
MNMPRNMAWIRLSWSHEQLEQALRNIMTDIHEKCVEYGTEGDYVNYRKLSLAFPNWL